jgi:hypothetical protein
LVYNRKMNTPSIRAEIVQVPTGYQMCLVDAVDQSKNRIFGSLNEEQVAAKLQGLRNYSKDEIQKILGGIKPSFPYIQMVPSR